MMFDENGNKMEDGMETLPLCMQCGMGVDETVEHMFLEYERYASVI